MTLSGRLPIRRVAKDHAPCRALAVGKHELVLRQLEDGARRLIIALDARDPAREVLAGNLEVPEVDHLVRLGAKSIGRAGREPRRSIRVLRLRVEDAEGRPEAGQRGRGQIDRPPADPGPLAKLISAST